MKQRKRQHHPMSSLRGLVSACLVSLLLKTSCAQDTEREILQLFYTACNGDNWLDNTNWLDDNESVCEWARVLCNQFDKVLELELPNNNVSCAVPPELFGLEFLEVLDLQSNAGVEIVFDGFTAPNLKSLYLADTAQSSLDGIENTLSLEKLKSFGAGGNDMVGLFPNQLSRFSNMRHLDLSHNLYSGTIPQDFATSLPKLRTVSVADNLVAGIIPPAFGTMSNLVVS